MSHIPLDRDLVFFDIESTGLNVIRDRIVQIAMVKLHVDGRTTKELEMLINPGIPVSEEAYAVHGLGPKELANKPSFQQVAQQLFDFIGGADLAGYNSNRFDVPLLMEEFARCGFELDISKRRLIDVQRIFYRMEPRTLAAAVKFYTGQPMENAHDALADVKATLAVFQGQLALYKDQDFVDTDGSIIEKPLGRDMDAIADFCTDTTSLDVTGRLKRNKEGVAVFNFGKYQGKSVGEVCTADPGFYNWLLTKDFTQEVKQMVKKIVEEYKKENRAQ